MNKKNLKENTGADLKRVARRQERRAAAARRDYRHNGPSGKSYYHIDEVRRLLGYTPDEATGRKIQRALKN